MLGPLDSGDHLDDYLEFEELCEAIDPLDIAAQDSVNAGAALKVFILTHKNDWIKGTAEPWAPPVSARPDCGSMNIDVEQEIPTGASGGPIVGAAGKLFGIVSDCQVPSGEMPCRAVAVRVALALPEWIRRFAVVDDASP